MTFVMQPLHQILPTSRSCFVRELKGRTCIVDAMRMPQSGDTVLLDMSGFLEWAQIFLHPRRLITDEGMILESDLLEDIAIVGVVTHEITALLSGDDTPI